MAKLEIASFNLNSAKIAQEFGADRVELCAGMEVGGTTPSDEDVLAARKLLTIQLNVMIRPRGGDFVYTDEEFTAMKRDILRIKDMGIDGFVFGILNADNTVNESKNRELVELALPFPCTFHRAFDEVFDFRKALEDVISCGFTTILTSGCEPNVDLGLRNLVELVKLSNDRIVIMPGGGLRSSNVAHLLDKTKATYFHSSAITDGSDTAVGDEVTKLRSQL
ncbi:copper homeostasis protein CutC [Sphingobacterium bovistauri]|uniref:PF03932 family protein CutC n=1 Tax=Sphingobacterium bovistauri TaxID=2781959 RepID=A0ABS7Z940_9SPHI|nr:copper homeostasis protein CutC [Sphingobacterium bovistauri]MCA5006713.1 copper homeostasis protein CutC [Sphingobacterium bovistauri]